MSDNSLGVGAPISRSQPQQTGAATSTQEAAGSTTVAGSTISVTVANPSLSSPLPTTAPANNDNDNEPIVSLLASSIGVDPPSNQPNPLPQALPSAPQDSSDIDPGDKVDQQKEAAPANDVDSLLGMPIGGAGGSGDDHPLPLLSLPEKAEQPTSLRGIVTLADPQGPQKTSYAKTMLKTAGALAFDGFVVGAVAGGGIASVPMAVAGAVGGAIVGAVVGGVVVFIKNKRAARAHKQAQQAQDQFDQAINTLKGKGIGFGKKQIDNINGISAGDWLRLLSVSPGQVGSADDRQKIRQAAVLNAVRRGKVESAMTLKEELVTACRENRLDLTIGCQFVREKGREAIPDFLREFSRVLDSKAFWSCKDTRHWGGGSSKLPDLPLPQASASAIFGGAMMLNALRRLQDPGHVVTEQDRWQINQGLWPEDYEDDHFYEHVSEGEVGRKMKYDTKVALADRMYQVYAQKWNMGSADNQYLAIDYPSAPSLEQKLKVLEDFQQRALDYPANSIIDAITAIPAGIDLTGMSADAVKPAPPPSEKELQCKAFFEQARAGIQSSFDKDDPNYHVIVERLNGALIDSLIENQARANGNDHYPVTAKAFVNDHDRIPFKLTDENGSVNLKERAIKKSGGDKNLANWDPRDELLRFCGGDKEVAKSLSFYIHQGLFSGMIAATQNSLSDSKLPSMSFVQDKNDKIAYEIKKDAKGNFTITASYEAGVNMLSPADDIHRMVDPAYNRCKMEIKIKVTAEHLRAGEGMYEFVELPFYSATFDPDRGPEEA